MKTSIQSRKQCVGLRRAVATTAMAVIVTVSAAQDSSPITIEVARHCSGPLGNTTVHVRLNNGVLQSSLNAVNWIDCAPPVKTFIRAVTCGQGQIVAVGGSYSDAPAVILTSRDGLKWKQRKIQTASNLYGVAFGDNLFVAVGELGTIFTSTNGVSWTRRYCAGTDALLATVSFSNGRFVGGGESGTIITSTNGLDWTRASLGASIYVGRITFTDGRFLVRSGADEFSSSDALTWKRHLRTTVAQAEDVSAR